MSYINIMSQKELKRNLVLIGILLILTGIILLLPKAFSSPVPIKSVTITSEKLNYSKKDPGSFNIEKSAEWISKGKARITFDVDTVVKAEDKYRDIIFVLDISGSMDGEKLNRVKADSIDLINTLLSDSNNRGALITFETSSQLVLGLTNNKDELTSAINSLTTTGCTNYYQALVNVDTILKNYKKEENRECIVLFLTDGYPNEDTPNEEGQYSYLKAQYPYVTINGIQYEMGSDVLDPIKKVSDQQFIADMTNLNNVLFEASVAPITYDSFSITDYINNDYFEVDSVESIVSSVGTTKLEYDGSTPKVIWNIGNLRSGSNAKLTIDINLKKEYIDKGGLYQTNKKEEIKTEIDKVVEDITSPKTPILSSHYQVIYDGNAPVGCVAKNVPETTTRSVFDTVEISTNEAVCEGYQFKGWTVFTENIKKINDNYFEMPSNDVVLRAVWSKISVSKLTDGEVYVAPPSIIKSVDWYQQTRELWKYKSSITKIVFEGSISDKAGSIETFDISAQKNESVIAHLVPNDDNTTYTAYIQGNEKVIANKDSSNLFEDFSKLASIEGLEYFDTSNATKMSEMFNGCENLKTLDLSTFDTGNVIYMNRMFSGCSNLSDINITNLDTSKVIDMSSMFIGCSSLTSIDLSSLDTSNVTNMSSLFSGCSNLSNINLTNLDTGKVENMGSMFYNCSSLLSIDLSSFDTSNVTNMSSMFYNLSKITSIDLHNFNTSKVTSMKKMFYECSGLKILDVEFLNTVNVVDMSYMFANCSDLTVLDLSSFSTGKVTDMSVMFSGCKKLTSIDLSSFDTTNVTSMNSLFSRCNSLNSLDLSKFDTSSVTTMEYMFYYCKGLTSLDLSNFDTSSVTNMKSMFDGCSSFTSLNLNSFDTSSVTTMENMFSSCIGLTKIDISSFNTSKVTTMKYMFSYCRSLTSLNLNNFDTSNVISMETMFDGCSGLTSLDLSNFNVSKVKTMSHMFDGCKGLTSLNLSNFNTVNVTSMYHMFYGCSNLTSLDLSSFDTGNVESMYEMFYGCSSLTDLDVSNFNTSNVTTMYGMFYKCSNLTTLDLSSFDTSKVKSMSKMFYMCSNLASIDLSIFDTSSVTTMEEMFHGCFGITTSITIMNTGILYNGMFTSTAVRPGAKVTVNYTDATSNLVDWMIQTKTSTSNVVKGELVN